ncbi:type 1 glutamine amidotransferase [Pseudoscardovia radai]|uniref:type 1 glutamine amidotransferase n=1 Tax=Pseudoscardovia radai TaxID=987066 RepID=UPI00399682AD
MSKPQVLILTHAPWERPGRILDALETCGLEYTITSILKKPKADLPDFKDLAGLVLMGGPMGALDYDEYPGLKTESKLAKAAIVAGKPVLGVCLGHQIMATALGGKLRPGKAPEIGFGTVQRLENSHEFLPMWGKKATVLHWHNDCVTLPAGATPLAKSDLTKVQAFRFGSALGMQFHLEVTPALFDAWLSEKEMVKDLKKSDVARLREEYPEKDALIKPFASAVFEGFAARCSTHAKAMEEAKPKEKKIVIS